MSTVAAPPSSFHLSPAAKDIVSGTCAGVMSIIVCHPLDTIRVRLQTTTAARFAGVSDVVRQTIGREGPLAFYKGMATPLVSQGVQKATMFFAFGGAKRQLSPFFHLPPAGPPPLPFIAVCGGIAGAANACIAAPIELIRNRLQVQYHAVEDKATARYKGPIDCIQQTVREGGVRGLWSGVLPMIYRDVPGVAAWYTGFEGSRRLLTAGQDPATVPKWKLLLAGACGGIGFWTFAFPQDLIKSIIQTHTTTVQPLTTATSTSSSSAPLSSTSSRPLSFLATARHLVATEGVGRLWRGFPIALFRGIPGAAITFTTYTIVMSNINQQGW